MTSLFGSQEPPKQLGPEKKDPAWFQNSSRRVIPNHLVPKKRLAFQLSGSANNKKDTKSSSTGQSSSNNNAFNSTDFNLISFGNTAHRNSTASHADTSSLFLTADSHDTSHTFDNDDIPLYNENEDLPPARSLYDLNDEVLISLNKPAQHTESFINKDPKTFVNAFYQKSDISKATDEDAVSNLSPLLNTESAILVFGYPEAMSSQVIAYFSEFGKILEQFEASKQSKNTQANILQTITTTGAFNARDGLDTRAGASSAAPSLPIFSGNSWVKITYDNPTSAHDALQESGNVFNGVLIGVVPYTKDAIEKLQKRKLSSSEDIGGGFQLFSHKETNEVDKGVIGDSNDMQASYIKRLDVKDGTGLFLKANANGSQEGQGEKKEEPKLGLMGSISKYFFGFHDL
ncbi:hypothetical protein JCM33374_g686 [Metschnikowia sp. JCM 33374]|nr:hypothetical protein JCM33374_g686 [Metschnikowia sp. JCM 33374]